MSEQIADAFAAVAAYAFNQGVRDLHHIEGCWESRVDERWEISLNGHDESTKDSKGVSVPPFGCAITYNGWPAGIIDPAGGIIAAGSEANEEAFIVALERAT